MTCKACGEDHDPRLRCEQALALRKVGGVYLPELSEDLPRSKVSVPVPPEIKKVQEFLKRGRPKVYPDRRTQMRELMRKRRAKSRA